MNKYRFRASVEIDAENEEQAREIFDLMREACVPSDYGVTLFDLRGAAVVAQEATP